MAPSRNARGYSTEQLGEFADALQRLMNETAGMSILLGDLSGRLTSPRARIFAREGIGRRLKLLSCSARNVFTLYQPGTPELLSVDTCDEVAIQFQAFGINLYGLMENVAWVCVLEAGGSLNPMKIGLFKREVERYLPDELREYVSRPASLTWFNDYGKTYRDSTAHRIPPYLPPRAYSTEEAQTYRALDRRAEMALIEMRQAQSDFATARLLMDQYEQLVREKEALGSNSLLVALSLNGDGSAPPVYLHPQLISDWGLAIELLQVFDSSLRRHYGWTKMEMPNLTVRMQGTLNRR